MSNVIKGVKKVFKKVTKVVKKIAPYAIAAAAIYFTAGVALSAMPATSAFAAGLPGFAGAGGAGTGILSKVAAKVGLGALGKAGGLAAAAGATGGGIAPGLVMGAGFMPTAGGAAAGGVMKAAGMSLTEKLMLASVGTNALGALLAPSPRETAEAEYSEQKKWRGSFYGMEAGGEAAQIPQPDTDSLFPERPRTPTVPSPSQPTAPKPSLAEQFSAPKLAANTMQAQKPGEFDLFRGFGNA